MLRRESSMSQRTFNEINASPTLFDELDEADVMQAEASPPSKSRRGRKRQSDEECLTEADRVKKEKNRKAAQKCREKKEKEAKDLKQRNEELERENKKLAEEKLKLENRALEFSKIIEDHISKGCKVPSNVQEMLQALNSHSNAEECELFRAVGTIESNHTPPPTPENTSSGKLSPHLPCNYSDAPGFSSVAPTALFSGAPLSEQELTRNRSNSISRSSSSSSPAPSPSPSPDQAVSQVIDRQKDLSYFLYSRKVPEALAPISPFRPRDKPNDVPQFSGRTVQAVPIVVSEIEESRENKGNRLDNHPSQVMAAAFQYPDVPVVDEVSMQLTQGEYDEGSQNLPSMGFSYNVEQYSYSEDLQQMETPQEIIEYTSEVQENNQQIFVSEELDNGQESSDGQPSVNVSVCARALLEMGSEMSESLKQQLKMSYTSSSSSALTETASKHVQARSEVSHQNIITQSDKTIKQNSQLAECQIPVNGQIPVNLSLIDQQMLFKQLLEIVKKQAVAVGDTDVLSQHVRQNQSLDTEGSKKILEQKLQMLAKKHPLPNNTRQLESDVLATKQGRKEQPAQQILRNHQIPGNKQISTLPVSHKISPQNKLTIPQTATERVVLINKPETMTQPKTSLSQNSFHASQLILTNSTISDKPVTQHAQVNKQPPKNYYIHPNAQTTRSQAYDILTSTVPLAQNLVVMDSSTVASDVDYSSNVQDLPSLNFTELNSEKNLFEKKPSRSSSS